MQIGEKLNLEIDLKYWTREKGEMFKKEMYLGNGTNDKTSNDIIAGNGR